jgi:extradiol dioxygenase family protein
MNDLERKKRLIVTALGAQQIYAQCHDECVDLKFFKHDLKMHSKNLIAKLERELMPIFGVLGNVDGGESYLKATELMEITLQNLAVLPVEYWALINNAILDLKKQIDEKNQAGADGVPSGEAQGVEPEAERPSNGMGDEPELAQAEEHEADGH